ARALVKEGKPVDFSYPKEGVRGWIDGPGIIKDGPHPNAAAAFINYVCGQPKAGIEMAKQFYYAPASQAGMAGLDETTKTILRVADLDQLLGGGQLKLIDSRPRTSRKSETGGVTSTVPFSDRCRPQLGSDVDFQRGYRVNAEPPLV